MILRECARMTGGDRVFGGFGKGPQFLRGFAGDDAAADIEHWALGFLDQADDFVKQIVRFRVRTGQINLGGPHRLGGLLRMFFRKSATTGGDGLDDVKASFTARDIADVGDKIAVFHDPEVMP